MLNPLVQKTAHLVAVLVLALALPCCGSSTQSENGALSIHLQLPENEDPTLFWYGVTQKNLEVSPKSGDEPTSTPWTEGQKPALDLHEGDQLLFTGSDPQGKTLVTGQATVGQEKTITIPLRRAL